MTDTDSNNDLTNIDNMLISDALLERFDYETLDSDGTTKIDEMMLSSVISNITVDITMGESTMFVDNTLLAYELSNSTKIIVISCSPGLVSALFKEGLGTWTLSIMQGVDVLSTLFADLASEETVVKLIKTGSQYELTIAWA